MSLYWPERLRVLASYAYPAAVDAALAAKAELLVDSGAFTAFGQGETIELSAYAEFLEERAEGIETAVTLDVIGDWRGTARNYDLLRERMGDRVNIMPVWHSGSPESELRRLCREHDYIGVGGVTTMASQVDKFMRHMVHAHRIAAETGTKLHGLGVTGARAMLDLPWWTVDSSSWLGSVRYGNATLTNPRGRFVRASVGRKLPHEFAQLLRFYDLDPAIVSEKGFAIVSQRGHEQGQAEMHQLAGASARAYLLMEGHMRRRHKQDARLYLALATDWACRVAHGAWSAGNPFAKGI